MHFCDREKQRGQEVGSLKNIPDSLELANNGLDTDEEYIEDFISGLQWQADKHKNGGTTLTPYLKKLTFWECSVAGSDAGKALLQRIANETNVTIVAYTRKVGVTKRSPWFAAPSYYFWAQASCVKMTFTPGN